MDDIRPTSTPIDPDALAAAGWLRPEEAATLKERMANYESANNELRDELMRALIDATDTSHVLVDVHHLLKDLAPILIDLDKDGPLHDRLTKVQASVAKALGLDEPTAPVPSTL